MRYNIYVTAYYNEKVTIVSRLCVELTATYLLVEMLMFDEKQQALKAVLWTNFTCIDPQTGNMGLHTGIYGPGPYDGPAYG